MGRLGEPAPKLIDEARLTESRLANDLNELPGAGLRALPTLDEDLEIVFATDKPRLRSRASASAAAAGTHDPVQNRRNQERL
jgi:hypothetical protein